MRRDRRVRRRLTVKMVACSGGDAGGDGAEVLDGELPGGVCVLLDRLEASEDLVDGREVLSLDEAALAEALAARRVVLEALARETDGDLRSLLEERVAAQPAIDEAMLAGWDEDRVRFAGDHNDRWLGEAVGQDVRRDDGEAVDIADFWVSVLVVRKGRPDLPDGRLPNRPTAIRRRSRG